MDKGHEADEPAKATSAVERVVTALRSGMTNRRFSPAQRLVEADLTAELGVSRGTLREAFRRLAADGLIEIVPNRGAIVRRLSASDVLELFEVRRQLEGLSAKLAARRVAMPPVRDAFTQATAPIWSDSPRRRVQDYMDENSAFHEAVYDAAGNRQLAQVSRQLQLPAIMSQLDNLLTPSALEESVAEHRAIAQAILEGDEDGAELNMHRHLERAARLTSEASGNARGAGEK
jgi:DNA-binding GntR family transcriptional regulator